MSAFDAGEGDVTVREALPRGGNVCYCGGNAWYEEEMYVTVGEDKVRGGNVCFCVGNARDGEEKFVYVAGILGTVRDSYVTVGGMLCVWRKGT